MQCDNIEGAIRTILDNERCVLDYDALLKSWNLEAGHRPGADLAGISRVNTSD